MRIIPSVSRSKLACLLLSVVVSLVASGAAQSSAKPLSVEQFFQKPEFTNPKLSYDGRYLAFLARQEDVLNLFVIDLQEKKMKKLTGFDWYDVSDYAWVSEKRLVLFAGDDNRMTGGVYAIDADGKNSLELVESLKKQSDTMRTAVSLGWFEESELARHPTQEILLHIYDTNISNREADLYRVNIHTGKRTLVLRNRDEYDGWLTDNQGRVRVAYKLNSLMGKLLYRADESSPWRTLREYDETKQTFTALCFDSDDANLWVLMDEGVGRLGLFKLNVETGKLSDSIAKNDRYDIDDVLRRRWDAHVEGYAYETDKWNDQWFDPELQKLVSRVEMTFPGMKCRLASSSADKHLLLLHVWSDREPGRYYLYERKVGKLESVGVQRPEIDPATMAAMEPFRIKARDGLELEGYLARPPGSAGKKLPLIVNPHGGPWARDSWGYNREVQFLASRGYAVLQVNFRGSTGYGRDFMMAGMRQWGLKMQDDITDAVKWCIEQQVADPDRIAIYGASYGGYAAMAGLVFTPDLYRCGINYVGVTDVGLLVKELPMDQRYLAAYFSYFFGDPKLEKEYIDRVSPVKHIDALKAPVFLAYGFRDSRVDIKHGNELIAELKRLKKPFEVMIKDNEGHGYYRRKNVIEFYTKMEAFLAKHLGKN